MRITFSKDISAVGYCSYRCSRLLNLSFTDLGKQGMPYLIGAYGGYRKQRVAQAVA